MHITQVRTVLRPRKVYLCWWCGHGIEGEHAAWNIFDGGEASSIRCHVECLAAWQQGLSDDPQYYSEEVSFGDHARGCLCDRGRCTCGKKGGAT